MPRWKIYSLALPAVCAAISVACFVYFGSQGLSSYANRGGAIGVMIAFASLFLLSMDRYHSLEILDNSSQDFLNALNDVAGDDPVVLSGLNKTRIDALKEDLAYARKQAVRENVSIAVSSVISTFFAGFGDIAAELIF
jgi:hypothetical protein